MNHLIMNKINLSLFLLVFATLSCAESAENSSTDTTYNIEVAFPALSFNRPVDLQIAGDDSNLIYVVEQAGKIFRFDNNSETSEKELFLDISSRVNDLANEEGLLGLAFHPNYKNNGYFFVNYTASNPKRTIIARFTTDQTSKIALPDSELEIISFTQPFDNHNGGQLVFGPDDGFLYIATGDGGSGGDPQNNAQNLRSLLGKILRIDTDNPTSTENYSIPNDNPFVNIQDASDEIYAYGLRNPWRISFDSDGNLWAADVGQNAFEEIDIIVNGGNYGWKITEGNHCFPSTTNCDMEGLIAPVWEYAQTGSDRSITGGYVYYGPSLPTLSGSYIYGDFVSGKIWQLTGNSAATASNKLLIDSNLSISSFGIDQSNELLICSFDGKIYQLKVN